MKTTRRDFLLRASALTTGVREHRVNHISIPFKAYLRVNLDS